MGKTLLGPYNSDNELNKRRSRHRFDEKLKEIRINTRKFETLS